MNSYEEAVRAYYESSKGIKIKQNEKIMLECKIDYWCYLFARDIKGANIKAHEQIVLELRKPNISYFFAQDIPGANIEEHFKVVFNSGNKDWFDKFIKYVNYENTKVKEWLLYI